MASAYAKVVQEVRTLLQTFNGTQMDTYIRLRELEKGGAWQKTTPPHPSFLVFLQKEFTGAVFGRDYARVGTALDIYGDAFMRKIGLDAVETLTAKKITNHPERVARLKTAIEEYFRKYRCAPSKEAVRDMARPIAPDMFNERSGVGGAKARIRELEAEIKRTLEEKETLQAAYDELKAKYEELRRTVRTSKKKSELTLTA